MKSFIPHIREIYEQIWKNIKTAPSPCPSLEPASISLLLSPPSKELGYRWSNARIFQSGYATFPSFPFPYSDGKTNCSAIILYVSSATGFKAGREESASFLHHLHPYFFRRITVWGVWQKPKVRRTKTRDAYQWWTIHRQTEIGPSLCGVSMFPPLWNMHGQFNKRLWIAPRCESEWCVTSVTSVTSIPCAHVHDTFGSKAAEVIKDGCFFYITQKDI